MIQMKEMIAFLVFPEKKPILPGITYQQKEKALRG
jgi:hypothetical protein